MNYEIPEGIRLKPKIKKFFDFYFTNGYNATQAAKDAGYSEKTAYSQGHAFLKTPEGQKIVEDYFNKIAEENRFRRDAAKEFLQMVIESKLSDFFTNENGKLIPKPFDQIPENLQKMIVELKTYRDGSITYKLFSKETAREMLNKIDGHYEKDNLQRRDTGPTIYIPDNGRNENASVSPEA